LTSDKFKTCVTKIDLLVVSVITFIARDKTSHQVRRMAMDPKYAGVTVKRWQYFMGATMHRGNQSKFDDMHPALFGVEVTGAPLKNNLTF